MDRKVKVLFVFKKYTCNLKHLEIFSRLLNVHRDRDWDEGEGQVTEKRPTASKEMVCALGVSVCAGCVCVCVCVNRTPRDKIFFLKI